MDAPSFMCLKVALDNSILSFDVSFKALNIANRDEGIVTWWSTLYE